MKDGGIPNKIMFSGDTKFVKDAGIPSPSIPPEANVGSSSSQTVGWSQSENTHNCYYSFLEA